MSNSENISPFLFAIVENGRFIKDPTIYIETAKSWITEGYNVTVFSTDSEVKTESDLERVIQSLGV